MSHPDTMRDEATEAQAVEMKAEGEIQFFSGHYSIEVAGDPYYAGGVYLSRSADEGKALRIAVDQIDHVIALLRRGKHLAIAIHGNAIEGDNR